MQLRLVGKFALFNFRTLCKACAYSGGYNLILFEYFLPFVFFGLFFKPIWFFMTDNVIPKSKITSSGKKV